jgi:hypothetical protein
MLSHAVMSVIQVFLSFVILSLACIFVSDGLPSIEIWFDHGEDRCRGLNKVGMVETVGFRQVMWLVMLESAKDRILGVDTSGEQVLPHVRYGTTYLLIRDGSLLCDQSLWDSLWIAWTTWCKRGRFVRETLALQAGTICRETIAKHDILL